MPTSPTPIRLLSPAEPSRSAPRPRPRPAPAAGHLDRSAITAKAHAAVRGDILAIGDGACRFTSYARRLGIALRHAWDAAYEAAVRAGEIAASVLATRRQRQRAEDRRRIAASPLAKALQRIASNGAAA